MRRHGFSLASLLLLVLAGCGGGGAGPAGPGFGTLTLSNASHLTMAPATIEQFLFVPQGGGGVAQNLLTAPVDPGGIVIVGLFQEGTYDGVAVLTGGFAVNFVGVEISADAPTTLSYP